MNRSKKQVLEKVVGSGYLDVDQRSKVIKEFFEKECLPKLQVKGRDYTDGLAEPSANANFRWVADFLGIPGVSHYTVWLIYFSKHFSSLIKWIKTSRLESEPLKDRIADMVNYLFILHSMIEEETKKTE